MNKCDECEGKKECEEYQQLRELADKAGYFVLPMTIPKSVENDKEFITTLPREVYEFVAGKFALYQMDLHEAKNHISKAEFAIKVALSIQEAVEERLREADILIASIANVYDHLNWSALPPPVRTNIERLFKEYTGGKSQSRKYDA